MHVRSSLVAAEAEDELALGVGRQVGHLVVGAEGGAGVLLVRLGVAQLQVPARS